MLKSVIETANAEAKAISICGEMAANPAYIELLVGLGAGSVSISPVEILEDKKTIRSLKLERAELLARRTLELGTTLEIKKRVLNP